LEKKMDSQTEMNLEIQMVNLRGMKMDLLKARLKVIHLGGS